MKLFPMMNPETMIKNSADTKATKMTESDENGPMMNMMMRNHVMGMGSVPTMVKSDLDEMMEMQAPLPQRRL